MSPNRRWIVLGVLLAAAAVLVSVVQRRDEQSASVAGGNVSACSRLEGDAARQCYRREVGRELSSVGGATPPITIEVPADTAQVTFAYTDETAPLLCDLHARVGVVSDRVPSWLGWTESLAESTPQS